MGALDVVVGGSWDGECAADDVCLYPLPCHENVRRGYACGRRSVLKESADVDFVEAYDGVWRWSVCRVEYGEELEHASAG